MPDWPNDPDLNLIAKDVAQAMDAMRQQEEQQRRGDRGRQWNVPLIALISGVLLALMVWAFDRRFEAVECVDPFPQMRYGGPHGCFVLDHWTGNTYFDQPMRRRAAR